MVNYLGEGEILVWGFVVLERDEVRLVIDVWNWLFVNLRFSHFGKLRLLLDFFLYEATVVLVSNT